MSAEDVRGELAELLGAMPEAVNVFDYTDEATTMLTAPVDLIADAVLTSNWLAEYVATKQAEALREAADVVPHRSRFGIGQWLRERADRIAP